MFDIKKLPADQALSLLYQTSQLKGEANSLIDRAYPTFHADYDLLSSLRGPKHDEYVADVLGRLMGVKREIYKNTADKLLLLDAYADGEVNKGFIESARRASSLGGHPKTGHMWSLQNRPMKSGRDKAIYNLSIGSCARYFGAPL